MIADARLYYFAIEVAAKGFADCPPTRAEIASPKRDA